MTIISICLLKLFCNVVAQDQPDVVEAFPENVDFPENRTVNISNNDIPIKAFYTNVGYRNCKDI